MGNNFAISYQIPDHLQHTLQGVFTKFQVNEGQVFKVGTDHYTVHSVSKVSVTLFIAPGKLWFRFPFVLVDSSSNVNKMLLYSGFSGPRAFTHTFFIGVKPVDLRASIELYYCSFIKGSKYSSTWNQV